MILFIGKNRPPKIKRCQKHLKVTYSIPNFSSFIFHRICETATARAPKSPVAGWMTGRTTASVSWDGCLHLTSVGLRVGSWLSVTDFIRGSSLRPTKPPECWIRFVSHIATTMTFETDSDSISIMSPPKHVSLLFRLLNIAFLFSEWFLQTVPMK